LDWPDRHHHRRRAGPGARDGAAAVVNYTSHHDAADDLLALAARLTLEAAILRLEIDASLRMLDEIFPAASDKDEDQDYAEPAAPRGTKADAASIRDGAGNRGGGDA
jgi:hypothetical protein